MKGRSGGVLVGEQVEWQSQRGLIESFAPAWARWLSGLGGGQCGPKGPEGVKTVPRDVSFFASQRLMLGLIERHTRNADTSYKPRTTHLWPWLPKKAKIQKEEKYIKENFYFKVVVLRSWAKGHKSYWLCGWRSFVSKKSWARHTNAFHSKIPITPLFKTTSVTSFRKFGRRCTNVSSFNDALESPRGNGWQIYLLHETATHIIL